jgi:transcriptional regulator with XRE-family HTH domain
MSLGKRILEARTERGWSQQRLADRLKVSKASISQWETHVSVPGTRRLEAIGRLLNVRVDWLLSGEGPRQGGGDEAPPVDRALLALCGTVLGEELAARELVLAPGLVIEAALTMHDWALATAPTEPESVLNAGMAQPIIRLLRSR